MGVKKRLRTDEWIQSQEQDLETAQLNELLKEKEVKESEEEEKRKNNA